MKKIKKSNRLLGTVLTVSAICALTISGQAFAAGEGVGSAAQIEADGAGAPGVAEGGAVKGGACHRGNGEGSAVDVGVSKKFLLKERNRAYKAEITPDCRQGCAGCGANCLLKEVSCDA